MGRSLVTGNRQHSFAERGDDLYESPEVAVHALLGEAPIPLRIWEPANGRGAISSVLEHAGYNVTKSDLVDYGQPDTDIVDFFDVAGLNHKVDMIVTNPPYKCAPDFIRHAINLGYDGWYLLRLNFMEGVRRADIMDNHLVEQLVFADRLPMMNRDGWEGPTLKKGAMPFAWFHFKAKPHDGEDGWHVRRIYASMYEGFVSGKTKQQTALN